MPKKIQLLLLAAACLLAGLSVCGLEPTNGDRAIIYTNRSTNARLSFCVTNSEDGSLSDGNGRYLIMPFRLRLPAKISTEFVTNWTITAITCPATRTTSNSIVTLEYRATGYHETGVIFSNTVATIEWRGKEIPVVLDSVPSATTNRVTWK